MCFKTHNKHILYLLLPGYMYVLGKCICDLFLVLVLCISTVIRAGVLPQLNSSPTSYYGLYRFSIS